MKQLNTGKITTFLVLCFGLSWGSFALLQAQLSTSPWIQGFLAILFIWAPGVAAILTHTFIYGEALKSLGYYKKPLSSTNWIRSRILPVGLLALAMGIIFLMGNIFHIPSAGKVVIGDIFPSPGQMLTLDLAKANAFGDIALTNNFIGLTLLMKNPGLFFFLPASTWANLGFLVLMAWLMGTYLFSFMLRGEELGFRGLLLEELRSKGFLGSNLIIGGIWGLYASGPLFLSPSPIVSPDQLLGSFLFTIGMCISMSFPLAYLRLKSGTIRASSVFRGLLVVFSLLLFLFTWDTNLSIWGINGLLGVGIFLILTLWILLKDKDFAENYEGMFKEE